MTVSAERKPGAGKPGESLRLREAAERLGVHYMTVYRYVRLGRLPASYAAGQWWVRPADVDRLREAPRRGRGHRQPARYRTRLYSRLLAGDEAGAWAVVESALAAGASPKAVVLELLAPVLGRIGDRWGSGELSVAEEHRAAAVALRVVGRLGPRFARRGRSRGAVLLAGAPGDPHGLPAALAADVLRGEGYTVVDLGADTPTGSVRDAALNTSRLLAVGISVGAEQNLDAAKRTVNAVHDAVPGIPVFVGGPAVPSRAAAEELDADGWAPDAGAFADLLAELRS
ncbi:MAG: B12-binding domain-containing protein [Streptosporangiales bacterium]